MCFEVIFQIVLALFAVFGIRSLLAMIEETWFLSDNVGVFVTVDTRDAAANIETYLREAGKVPLSRGGVTILVEEGYADEDLLKKLKRRGLRVFIVNKEDRADRIEGK